MMDLNAANRRLERETYTVLPDGTIKWIKTPKGPLLGYGHQGTDASPDKILWPRPPRQNEQLQKMEVPEQVDWFTVFLAVGLSLYGLYRFGKWLFGTKR